LFQEIRRQQQQPVALTSNAAMDKDSLDMENPPAAKAKKKTLASFFKENTQKTSTASTTFDPKVEFREAVDAELNAYIYMPSVDHGEDPLKVDLHKSFHKINFPRLCKLAQKYLCIQATSSASERVFSTSGNNCIKSSLLSETREGGYACFFGKEPLKR